MRVEIGFPYSKIIDASKEEIDYIYDLLSVHPKNYFFMPKYKSHHWDGYIHFLDRRGNHFPTGLLPELLASIDNSEQVSISDSTPWNQFSIPNVIKIGDKQLRDYQVEAVRTALNKRFGIINATMNAGKSLIATVIIQQLLKVIPKEKIIIFFVHKKEIYDQTVAYLEKYLNIKVGQIKSGVWDVSKVTVAMLPTVYRHFEKPQRSSVELKGDYKVVYNVLKVIKNTSYYRLKRAASIFQNSSKKSDQQIADYLVDVIVNQKDLKAEAKKLQKTLDKYVDKKIEKKMLDYNQTKQFLESSYCVIQDEEQHASARSFYEVIMACPAPYRFGLSGTIDPDDKASYYQQMACTGPIIYKVSNAYMIDHGYSAKPTVYLETVTRPKLSNSLSWNESYRIGIEENPYRNDKIVKRVVDKYRNNKTCLIIVNRIVHGKTLNELVHKNGVRSEFINGSLPDEIREKFLDEVKNGKLRILIATNILDEGVNVPNINCVFIASGGKSYRQILQRVGRGLRIGDHKKEVEIYDYLDYTNKYLVKHTAQRFNYYKNEGFTIKHAR